LQALRQAESVPLDQSATTPQKAAKKKKKAAKEMAPYSAPNSDEQNKALEVLRQAEAQPVVNQIPAPSAPAAISTPAAPATAAVTTAPVAPPVATAPIAPAVTTAPVAAAAPNSEAMQNEQLKALQALHQAEDQQLAPAPATPAQTIAAEKAAADAAKAKAKKDAAARKKAQEEAARSVQQVEHLQSQVKNAAPTASTNTLSSKEQKLADLLRRYQADEITPYEYHLERAKIVAEP